MLPINQMQLSQWLAENEITSAEFADNIGVTSEAVRLYLRGARFPRRGVLADISDATKGAVTANDFADTEAGT